MQLQLEIGGLTNNIRRRMRMMLLICMRISIPFEAVYYFYKAPVHLECDQAFYRRKNRALFLGYAQNLKNQWLILVGFALSL